VTADGLGGGRRLWRHEAGSTIWQKKLQERSSLREARELKFAQNSIDEYGIPWVEM